MVAAHPVEGLRNHDLEHAPPRILKQPSDRAISIRPFAGAPASDGGGSIPDGSTTTGTKPPRSRNRRRQLKTWLAFTSLRRATTDTDTPDW